MSYLKERQVPPNDHAEIIALAMNGGDFKAVRRAITMALRRAKLAQRSPQEVTKKAQKKEPKTQAHAEKEIT